MLRNFLRFTLGWRTAARETDVSGAAGGHLDRYEFVYPQTARSWPRRVLAFRQTVGADGHLCRGAITSTTTWPWPLRQPSSDTARRAAAGGQPPRTGIIAVEPDEYHGNRSQRHSGQGGGCGGGVGRRSRSSGDGIQHAESVAAKWPIPTSPSRTLPADRLRTTGLKTHRYAAPAHWPVGRPQVRLLGTAAVITRATCASRRAGPQR